MDQEGPPRSSGFREAEEDQWLGCEVCGQRGRRRGQSRAACGGGGLREEAGALWAETQWKGRERGET